MLCHGDGARNLSGFPRHCTSPGGSGLMDGPLEMLWDRVHLPCPSAESLSSKPPVPPSWGLFLSPPRGPDASERQDICAAFLPLPSPPSLREMMQMGLPSLPLLQQGTFVMRTLCHHPVTAECGSQAAPRPQKEREGFREGAKCHTVPALVTTSHLPGPTPGALPGQQGDG